MELLELIRLLQAGQQIDTNQAMLLTAKALQQQHAINIALRNHLSVITVGFFVLIIIFEIVNSWEFYKLKKELKKLRRLIARNN